MAKLNLTAPWNEYYEELAAFFAEDPEVTILYDEEAKDIKVLVQDPMKAEALTDLLAGEKEFGSTKLVITVVPANKPDTRVKSALASLAENIARDIFVTHNGVFFCTDTRTIDRDF